MLVDVMVPAYGDGALLRETVRSVIAQSDGHWRLTVIDDRADPCGTAELGNWLASLQDDRVRLLTNPVRLGINRNFQRCLDESSAEFVQLLGADDRLLPDSVERVRRAATRHPDVAFIHTGASIIDADGRAVKPLVDRIKRAVSIRTAVDSVHGGEELAASLLRGNWMYFPSVVFRRDAVVPLGFRPGYDIVLDLDLYLRLLVEDRSCLLFASPGLEYRRHAASVSSEGAGDGSRFAEEVAYFAEAESMMRSHGWPSAARAARLHLTSRLHAIVRAVALARARRWGAARSFAAHAVTSAVSRRDTPREVQA
ncbi:glycosyltransferase [Actinomycetospora sp. NBRC 106378]|uniref:glycosyltransferase family 2 protein n=1 Tax=Actinomycetospora sp. NBRC 106378 TaxID=3032208 RepID=UPI0024A150BA|nr:glycosyltransferase [Actinomycetospora sp. NBRC 106378]GLZ52726.1 hypothetical protein Acsp07_23430 [Actinomycetospora sp. NBRC 106378]